MISFPLKELLEKSEGESDSDSIVVAISYLYYALQEISSQLDDLNKELMRKI